MTHRNPTEATAHLLRDIEAGEPSPHARQKLDDMASRYVMEIPTMDPRPADDYDMLCLRLYWSSDNPARRVVYEREIIRRGRELGYRPGESLDMAWTHARTTARCCRPA